MNKYLLLLLLIFLSCSKGDSNDTVPVDNVEQFKNEWGRKVWEDFIQSSCVDLSGEGYEYLQLNIDSNTAYTKARFVNWSDVIQFCGAGLTNQELNYINSVVDENDIQRECNSVPYEDSKEVIEITSAEENRLLVSITLKQDQSKTEIEYVVYPNILPVEMYEYTRFFNENGEQLGSQTTRVWQMSESIESVGCFRN